MHLKNGIHNLIIVLMLLSFLSSSSAMDNGYARIVNKVNGLQDYDLHWNDRFPQGSIVKLYVETSAINHRREVAIDYLFIVKDSSNNVVDTKSYSNKYHDYRENDFITYSMQVPQSWEDGAYTVNIHIFDLLNDTIMDQYQNDVDISFLNDSSKPDIPYMERDEILNLTTDKTQQYLTIKKIFFVDKYANKYPADMFRVESIKLDRNKVAPKEPISVSVNISNNFYEKGSTSIDLLVDNELVDSAVLDLEGSSTGQAILSVSTEHIGEHTIEIIPTGKNTIAMNNIAFFEVNDLSEFEIPTEFNFMEIRADKLNVEQNKLVNVSITIQNKGQNGALPVKLFINNLLEEEREVHLNFSETKDIIFGISRPDLGAYRVTIGGTNLSKVFFVGLPEPTPSLMINEPQIEEKPKFSIVLGLSSLLVMIYLLRRYLNKRFK